MGLIRIASAENNNNKNVKTSALLIVALGSFLVPFMGSSLSIALPLIQKDLSVNIILLGWIPTAFVLANAAFLLPFGRLADIHGRKKIFTYGVIIYTIASFLAALSPSAIYLIMGSFLQGMGCALIFATGVALLSSVYPSNHRGEVFGFFVTAVYVGLFLGPLLGGFLAQNLGWRSIFLFNVPFGLLLLTLILWKLKGEWFGSKNGVFDLKGTIIYIPSLIAILYGFSTLQSNLGQVIFIAGVIGVLIFILQEIRSFNPILKLKEYRSRTSSFSALALLLMNISTTALWTLLSLYLQDLLSLGPQITAIIISVEPLMVAIFSPPVGRLSDHMDNRILSATGMAITSIGLLILSFLNFNTGLWVVIIGLILIGLGLALFSPPTTNIFMGSMKRENYGMASATLSTMIYAGQTFSLGLLLLIFTTYIGKVEITTSNFNQFLFSLKTAFMIFAFLSALGVIVTILMGKQSIKSSKTDQKDLEA